MEQHEEYSLGLSPSKIFFPAARKGSIQDLVSPVIGSENESASPKSQKHSLFSNGFHNDDFFDRMTNRRDAESMNFAQKYLFNNTTNQDNLEDDDSNPSQGSVDQDTFQQLNEEQDESSFS